MLGNEGGLRGGQGRGEPRKSPASFLFFLGLVWLVWFGEIGVIHGKML